MNKNAKKDKKINNQTKIMKEKERKEKEKGKWKWKWNSYVVRADWEGCGRCAAWCS